ncbi:hypothetical protein QJS10_CPA07g00871 [Acorus calamus]|uniref:Uncharacterized protein n=1 Tax=Acorus calamus TaxID=4465 RepID=A0AAV9EFT1_ACOCL|nr:hypothetical protein QJS10_CPA07g00871 [Acorus calamus]
MDGGCEHMFTGVRSLENPAEVFDGEDESCHSISTSEEEGGRRNLASPTNHVRQISQKTRRLHRRRKIRSPAALSMRCPPLWPNCLLRGDCPSTSKGNPNLSHLYPM